MAAPQSDATTGALPVRQRDRAASARSSRKSRSCRCPATSAGSGYRDVEDRRRQAGRGKSAVADELLKTTTGRHRERASQLLLEERRSTISATPRTINMPSLPLELLQPPQSGALRHRNSTARDRVRGRRADVVRAGRDRDAADRPATGGGNMPSRVPPGSSRDRRSCGGRRCGSRRAARRPRPRRSGRRVEFAVRPGARRHGADRDERRIPVIRRAAAARARRPTRTTAASRRQRGSCRRRPEADARPVSERAASA